MLHEPEHLIARKVAIARLAEGFERLWAAAYPLAITVMAGLIVALSGLAGALPDWGRYGLGLVFLVALAAALKPLYGVRWPGRDDALRRIERTSGLRHRPLATLDDQIADPAAGPETRRLWQEHRARLLAGLRRLRAGPPRSHLPARDPYALRNALAIGLIAVLALGGWNWRDRLAGTFHHGTPAAGVVTSVDAWITPPAYTRKPPVLLSAAARPEDAGDITVPEGSVLVVRFNGTSAPALVLAKPNEDGTGGPELSRPELKKSATAGVYETRAVLDRPVSVIASNDGDALAQWHIAIIPDEPPTVSIAGDISVTPTGGFSVPWTASDDYGVAGIKAHFALAGADGEKAATKGLKYDPPVGNVSLPRLNPKDAKGKAFFDFTQHPWAGLEVSVTLQARDQAGQVATSKPVTFKLPEREFTKPLARALIEQRRELVRDPGGATEVARVLSALMLWPQGILDKSGPYLALRNVTTSLYRAQSDDDLKSVVEGLWQVALIIENGDLSAALKELDALRKELQKALAEGAPPDKIAELMDKLREALDRYVAAMNRQLQEAMKNGQFKNLQQMPQGQQIQAQDLKRMLDTIENLARSGARDAAQELLSQLENILKNLQPAIGQMQPGRTPPMARMLDQLSQMMRRQQKLMDDTFRLPDGAQQGMPMQPDGQEPGARGNDQRLGQGLASQQEALGRLLQELMRQLGQQGLQRPQGLNRAQRSMQGATEALRGEKRGEALGKQGDALDGLRESAQAMAQRLMQQGTGNQGNYGRHGEGRNDSRDPLGRPQPSHGEDLGPGRDMLPSASAIERAKEILDALRGRASDRTRPRLELDYIDRLLKGLY